MRSNERNERSSTRNVEFGRGPMMGVKKRSCRVQEVHKKQELGIGFNLFLTGTLRRKEERDPKIAKNTRC